MKNMDTSKNPTFVVPAPDTDTPGQASAGIQRFRRFLDPDFRRNDVFRGVHISLLMLLALSLAASGCSHSFGVRYPPGPWADDDRRPTQMPEKELPFTYPSSSLLEQSRQVEMIFELTARITEMPTNAIPGGTDEATNIDDFDEAPDSTWFANRLGAREMTEQELLLGPGEVALPTQGPLEVAAMGRGIVTPWILARSGEGKEYLFTFDDPSRPTMATGAGFLVGRALFAAGYNVPPTSILPVDTGRFRLADKTTFRDAQGSEREATPQDLSALVAGVARSAHSQLVRTLATAKPAGVHIGPFAFRGRRRHDENDRIRHDERRELRGLHVFSSWLDHRFTIDEHTADIFVPEGPGQGYLTHYLVGFEESLGNLSAALAHEEEPAHPQSKLKPTVLGYPPVTLYSRQQVTPERQGPTPFDAEHLDPYWWEPWMPNMALWSGTNRDEFWGSAILARFTDERIGALVTAAHFDPPSVGKQIQRALGERRDKILAFWLERVNPLRAFSAETSDGANTATFEDVARTAGLTGIEQSTYRYRLRTANGRAVIADWAEAEDTRLTLDAKALAAMQPDRLYTLEVQTLRPGATWPLASVNILFEKETSGAIAIRGVRRHGRR